MSQTGILLITPLRLLKFFSGLAIIQLAVASFLQIGIGSDSFTVFQQGLSKVCSVSVGTANFLLTFVLLVIVFFLDRSQFKIGMVLSVAFAGLFLDAMTKLVKAVLPEAPTIPVIALEFALTCMVVCIGFPLLKSAGLGVAPNDALKNAELSKEKGDSYVKKTGAAVHNRTKISRGNVYGQRGTKGGILGDLQQYIAGGI